MNKKHKKHVKIITNSISSKLNGLQFSKDSQKGVQNEN